MAPLGDAFYRLLTSAGEIGGVCGMERMAEQVIFGRRGARPPEPPPARVAAPPGPSSPELEAFAASIRDARLSDAAEFARWRRRQLPRRLLMILVRLALVAPGLLCFAVHAPWWISSGLEVAGVAANAWVRGERRRQVSAIAGWEPEA